jgi:hypothetical protein
MFFFQKKYSDFGGGKNKYSDSEFLSYNLMLNSGKIFHTWCNKKNKYSNFLLSSLEHKHVLKICLNCSYSIQFF